MANTPINPAAAASAYANTAKSAAQNVAAPADDQVSFGDVMKDMAMKTVDVMKAGETASARAVTGEATLPEVVQAVTAAELTLQTVVAVRDRLVGAYQEIMRMPI